MNREPSDFNDEPISKPDDDAFGFDPFAKAIADCIIHLPTPLGSVVAINGRWGAGKSSVVNLVKHHLSASGAAPEISDFQA